jgi:hypothetical protein
MRIHCALLVVFATLAAACATQAQQIHAATEKVASLHSTAIGITEAWLKGEVSGTYAETALAETFRLLESSRAQLHSNPSLIANPQGAALSSRIERLAHLIASLIKDVDGSDGASARKHLGEVATLEKEST